ncbi:MBL fold metallo-hydrolase [Candidatus Gottesmanbacteria bacterium]|nr:MBL fold metallo-hydrolase [Candidatus Gottesmanbacteria bacterium]
MTKMKISPKFLLSGALIGLVLLLAAFFSFPDGKLHLVFCDVGQGDAIYIKAATGEDILIDGGPNEKVLSCLGSHMPFYDRTIDLVILSHPQADHLNGLISVLERYNVEYFVSSGAVNETEGFKKLQDLLKDKKISQKNFWAGGKIEMDNLEIRGLWPEDIHSGRVMASTSFQPATPGVVSTEDINENSLVLKLSYGSFDALLTGDAGAETLEGIGGDGGTEGIEVLKVPHHGSKTSLLESFLEAIKPQLAIISVGKNSYGHPAEEILRALRDLGVKTLRTDKDGEIEIVSDGKGWQVKD